MSGNFIENTIKWLRKKIRKKVKLVKTRLKKKLNFLVEEKRKNGRVSKEKEGRDEGKK